MFGLRRGFRWVSAKLIDRAQRLLLYILSTGPIPQHVAFIMDGNRRYARQKKVAVQKGHVDGFAALHRMLEICLHLDIRCVTVYAFAMDNFKRPKEEVDALMVLLEEKLYEITQKEDLLNQYGVRLNIIGRKELFPESVRVAMQKAEGLTRHNRRSMLNVCMAYSSRDEMTTAIESSIRLAIKSRPDLDQPKITVDDIDSQLLTSRVRTPPLDILIRSSGVHRLSDFLLWQCCEDTQIHVCTTMWPDFGLWDFLPIILDFQRKVWTRQRELSGH